MLIRSLLCSFFMVVLMSAFCHGAEPSSQTDITQLEAHVQALLKQNSVDQRSGVDDVFQLADIYQDRGKIADAKLYYEAGLKVDPWRLEYQLKLANILADKKDSKTAIEKAQLVYTYAEDESLIEQSRSLLVRLGRKVDSPAVGQGRQPDNRIKIFIIPIGDVNATLLEEVRVELEKATQIRYDITKRAPLPDAIDRSYAVSRIDSIFQQIKGSLPETVFAQLLSGLQLAEKDLDTYEAKRSVVQYYFRMVMPNDEFMTFCEHLAELEKEGQYDANKLLATMRRHFTVRSGSRIKGQLGVMEEDIYARDYNFLFGLGSPGFGVMSYHRFRSDFNQTRPNRPRLAERMVKQCISSTFHILGIPRCTTPTCARAYPNDLEEHDRKNVEMCSACRKSLQSITNTK